MSISANLTEMYEARHQNPYGYIPASTGISVVSRPYRPDEWNAAYGANVDDKAIQQSGLRGRKLVIVLAVLCALWALAAITFLVRYIEITVINWRTVVVQHNTRNSIGSGKSRHEHDAIPPRHRSHHGRH